MPKSYSVWDMSRIPVVGLVPEKSASAPGSPVAGQMWVDTSVTPNKLKWYDGTQWVASDYSSLPSGYITDTMISGVAAISLSKLATNPLARANHTGTQAAASISDFDAQVRTSRLDQMVAPTTAVPFGFQKITNLGSPTNPNDAASKSYVDNARAGIAGVKDPVRVIVNSNTQITSPLASYDGLTLATNDRLLLTAQTTGTENGIWIWNGAGNALTRPTDADATGEILDGTLVAVAEGTFAGYQYIQTATPTGSPGTWTQAWVPFSTGGQTYTAGNGLSLTGGQFSIAAPVSLANGGTGATTAAAARTNLGTLGRFTGTNPALTAGVPATVTHSLGNINPHVQFFDATTNKMVQVDWNRVDANSIQVTADVAVAAAALSIVVFA